jgi:molybdopterin/thiamine biosynthesis adenylyltransferase
MTQAQYDALRAAVFELPGLEGAAYLLCRFSDAGDTRTLLCRDVVPVEGAHYLARERARLSIVSDSFVSVAKRARREEASILFAHSHPDGPDHFSDQDDVEEPKLMDFFQARSLPHLSGSLVLTPSTIRGRAWNHGAWFPLDRIRVHGTRIRYFGAASGHDPPAFFDRQVRAFGPDVQRLLQSLHVGVVGVGGTGSATAEQLVRLGVGRLTLFDGDRLDVSNVNRVYNSRAPDYGRNKARLAKRRLDRIAVGTHIVARSRFIDEEAVARELRSCDVIFGCTDNHLSRAILVNIAVRYLVPIFDMAVKIVSEEQVLRGVEGRVTTLIPGEACLLCRGRIDADVIAAESMSAARHRALVREGYAPELETNSPAVIPFTTAVAAAAVSEMLHRLTGFMGEDRFSSELLLLLHEPRMRTNRTPPDPGCICSRAEILAAGDESPFLGMTWAR